MRPVELRNGIKPSQSLAAHSTAPPLRCRRMGASGDGRPPRVFFVRNPLADAALYAFAEARAKSVVCFAHVTNRMAVQPGDFEKGRDHGSHDALEVVRLTVEAWLAGKAALPTPSPPPSP